MLFNYVELDGKAHLVLTATESHEGDHLLGVIKNINTELSVQAKAHPENTTVRFGIHFDVTGDWNLDHHRRQADALGVVLA